MAINDQKSFQPPTAPTDWKTVVPRIKRHVRHQGRMSGFVRKCPAYRKFQPLPPPTGCFARHGVRCFFAQAARISEFAERTLRRWLDDDDFRGELTRLRQESAELARMELQGLMLRSISVLSEAMDDPDKAIRLRAARYAMSFAFRMCETEKLKKDIQDLEEAVALGNAQHPVK